jgi:hypothetical protein
MYRKREETFCLQDHFGNERIKLMQQNTVDKCARLRKLHARLTEELRALKETKEEVQQESFDNPLALVNVIKSLQSTLNTIDDELAKCPAE